MNAEPAGQLVASDPFIEDPVVTIGGGRSPKGPFTLEHSSQLPLQGGGQQEFRRAEAPLAPQ